MSADAPGIPSPRLSRASMPPGTTLVAASLLWTLGTGLVLGVKSVRPGLAMHLLPWERVLPAHTLGVMVLLMAGVGALLERVIEGGAQGWVRLRRLMLGGLAVFFVAGAGAVVAGHASGLEYITWPLALSVMPGAFLVVAACSVWFALDHLCSRSPEGAWLLLMGLVLAVLGLAHRLAGAGVPGPTRALTIEWHALDTIFAGLNTSLYGLGILLSSRPGGGRRLRSPRLYALAVVALLSTFGHHHYASGQPEVLKWTAFGASMLGIVSFLRHLAMTRKGAKADRDDAARFMRLAGVWTAFAVGSGVLFAVPPLNRLVHGTHAIVAHSMGSVIGVNVFLILSGLLAGLPERRLTRVSGVASVALLLMVTDLFAAGVLKGVLRLDGARSIDLRAVRAVLMPLPVFGLGLAGSLGIIAWRITRSAWHGAPAAPRVHGRAAASDEPGRRVQRAGPRAGHVRAGGAS